MDEFYSLATLAQVDEERQKEKEQRRLEEERKAAGKDAKETKEGGRDRGRRCVRASEAPCVLYCVNGRRWGRFVCLRFAVLCVLFVCRADLFFYFLCVGCSCSRLLCT